MSRSKEGYLWTSDGTSTGGLTTQSVIASSKTLSESYDVIIIGCGFAGLTAARELSQHNGNLKILMLEGRDRIGGRTWTADALGEQFEMGGTWVHWSQPHLYRELHRYGLHSNLKSSAGTIAPSKVYYKPAQGPVAEVDGTKATNTVETIANAFFEIDGHTSRSLMPYPHYPWREQMLWKEYDHMSIRERLDQMTQFSEEERDIFESYIGSLGSASGMDIGFVEFLRWYALSGHSLTQMFELCGTYKIGNGGMTRLAVEMFKEFEGDMLTGAVVKEVRQDKAGVRIRLQSGRWFRAGWVLSTIPLNCLSDIQFTPPLSPVRQEATRQGHINKGAKIHYKLQGAKEGWFGTCSARSDNPLCFAFSDHNGTSQTSSCQQQDSTFCIGFAYNNYLTEKRNSQEVIEAFRRCIRPDADVQAYLTHDWMNAPLAKGVWACWGPMMMSQYLQELQRSHGKAFFASADWADGWRGFVDGAIESGGKAARDLLAALRAGNRSSKARL